MTHLIHQKSENIPSICRRRLCSCVILRNRILKGREKSLCYAFKNVISSSCFKKTPNNSVLQIPSHVGLPNVGLPVRQVFHCLPVKCFMQQPLEKSPAGLIDPINAYAFARCGAGTQLLGRLSRDSVAARDAFTGEPMALLCPPTSGQMNSEPLN